MCLNVTQIILPLAGKPFDLVSFLHNKPRLLSMFLFFNLILLPFSDNFLPFTVAHSMTSLPAPQLHIPKYLDPKTPKRGGGALLPVSLLPLKQILPSS